MSNLPEGNSENAGSIGVVSAEHSIAHDRLGGQVDDSRWSDDHLNCQSISRSLSTWSENSRFSILKLKKWTRKNTMLSPSAC